MNNAKTKTIGDIMTKAVISVDGSVTVNEAVKMMEDAKVESFLELMCQDKLII